MTMGPAPNVLFLACLLTAISSPMCGAQLSPADQLFYANVKPYLEESPEKLIAQIPELQGLRPAADQQLLSRILASTGHVVEAYFNNLIDLIAREDIDQEVLKAQGIIKHKMPCRQEYPSAEPGARGARIYKGPAGSRSELSRSIVTMVQPYESLL
jgi:hypothetical protein